MTFCIRIRTRDNDIVLLPIDVVDQSFINWLMVKDKTRDNYIYYQEDCFYDRVTKKYYDKFVINNQIEYIPPFRCDIVKRNYIVVDDYEI